MFQWAEAVRVWVLMPREDAFETSLPVGIPVASTPAKQPQATTLTGRLVTVVPLDPVSHGEALYRDAGGEENSALWTYLSVGPFQDRDAFDKYLKRIAAAQDPLFFAILDNATGEAAGHASYMRIEPAHRVVEVGSILYTRRLQHTAGATEAMYLMARHVFEELGYRRYEWKCYSLNAASRRAALRLGFTFEGIFRQHMIIKGRNRDTAWFSMLDSEWPARKEAFEHWLDPANFDSDGRQRRSLAEFRARS